MFLSESDRTHGYSFVGTPALVAANYVKGTKWTVMLALSYRGLVNYWIHKENTSGEVRLFCFDVFHVCFALRSSITVDVCVL